MAPSKLNGAKLSLADFNDVRSMEKPIDVPVLTPGGEPSGLVLKVIGDQSGPVEEMRAVLQAEETARAASAMADAKPGEMPVSETPQQLKRRLCRLCAARIVGWEGVEEEFNPALAYDLVAHSDRVFNTVTTASQKLGNFTKR